MNVSNKSQKRLNITAITVKNYKSICKEQRVVLKPLTLLAGANSSGKSSIMQPILLLKQTLEAPYDPGALLLDGPNVKLTSTEQLFCRIEPGGCDSFSIAFEINSVNLSVQYKKNPGPGVAIGIESMTYISGNKTSVITENMESDEIESILPKPIKDITTKVSTGDKQQMHWVVERDRCFLNFSLRYLGSKPTGFAFGGVSPSTLVVPHLENIIHVPGLRGNPARTYRTTAVGSRFPGSFENYCASIINHWQATKDNRLKALGKAFETLGLTWKVEAKPVDDTQVELRVGRLPHSVRGGAHDLVSIADVGFGVSQTLPVIVALLAAKPGQIVYIEQPEIHLHPRAQKIMAQLLADAALRGVVVIVETHSSLLLRGIQTLVAKGDLPSNAVSLHWFTREEKSGATMVDSSGMDEQGAFGQWPEDFDDVILQAEMEYMDAVESQGANS